MKDIKKHQGTKARVRAYKKRLAHIGATISATIIIVIIATSIFLIYSSINPLTDQTCNPDQTNNPSLHTSFQPKAAIVDHLSLSCPNHTFIETATNILKKAGYTVDYYPGEKVRVEFYRNLPTHGYGLIILRVHSSATEAIGTEGPVTLFTSEPYSKSKHVYEQLTDKLCAVAFSREQAEKGIKFFGISPLFVTESMKGRFQNTIIIMMGCEGLDNPLMAMAFVEKGAKVYMSWNQQVLASHTDLATAHILRHFLIEKRTLKESVRETFKEVGFDPAHRSLLIYYPLEAGDQTIEDITGNPRTNS